MTNWHPLKRYRGKQKKAAGSGAPCAQERIELPLASPSMHVTSEGSHEMLPRKAPMKLPGGSPEAPGGSLEAPRRLPRVSQEALGGSWRFPGSPRRLPECSGGSKGGFDRPLEAARCLKRHFKARKGQIFQMSRPFNRVLKTFNSMWP